MNRLWSFLIAIISVSCSFEPYRGPAYLVNVKWPENREAAGRAGPSTYNDDCYFIDVNGPGIPKMFSSSNRYEILDLGLNGTWQTKSSLASGTATLSVRVPPGPARTIRIFGVKNTPAITGCSSKTFYGHPNSGVLSEPPLPQLYEIGRATVDLTGPATVTTAENPAFATDIIAANAVVLAGPLGYYRSTTTGAPTFTDGAPGNSGGFSTYADPVSSAIGVTSRARIDVVVNLAGQNLSGFNIVNVHGTIEGYDADCGTGVILTRRDVNMGLWNEGQGAWATALPVVTSTSQGDEANYNFKGVSLSGAVTTVVPPVGSPFSGLILSFRVPDAPAGGNCSRLTLTQLGIDFYP